MYNAFETDTFRGFARKVALLRQDPLDPDPRDTGLFGSACISDTALAGARRLHTDRSSGTQTAPESETRPKRGGSDAAGSAVADSEIVGRSPALLRALLQVEQVADTDASVLIFGETGIGKDAIAKAVHRTSPRRDRPLVKVNCAALPATLIESELFGHERGAFTGATRSREGRFALADGGTLFLDEIGELPLELQGKLLRVLQEGEFEPVGSSRTRRADVRLIAATNRDLPEAIEAGRFRPDLYYRVNVFPIRLPPLRERKQDIPELVEAFAARFARRFGRRVGVPSEDTLRRLETYDWPGNVRELQNIVERAVILSRGGPLQIDGSLAPAHPRDAAGCDPAARVLTAEEMRSLERDNLVRGLNACGWRVAGKDGAARLLGMNPSTLSSRMKALRIQRERIRPEP